MPREVRVSHSKVTQVVRGGKERLRLPEFRLHAPSREEESGANNQDHATTMTNLPVETEAENPVLQDRMEPMGSHGRGRHRVRRVTPSSSISCVSQTRRGVQRLGATATTSQWEGWFQERSVQIFGLHSSISQRERHWTRSERPSQRFLEASPVTWPQQCVEC